MGCGLIRRQCRRGSGGKVPDKFHSESGSSQLIRVYYRWVTLFQVTSSLPIHTWPMPGTLRNTPRIEHANLNHFPKRTVMEPPKLA